MAYTDHFSPEGPHRETAITTSNIIIIIHVDTPNVIRDRCF